MSGTARLDTALGAWTGTPKSQEWQTARVQTIGLVGGMSWESSAVYYRDLNLGVQQRLGGLSSPRLVLSTVDFAELRTSRSPSAGTRSASCSRTPGAGVERAGADFLLLCTTTFHRVADQVEAAVDIPLLHLADVVAAACLEQDATTVGLIGTRVAMSDGFFAERLARHGVTAIMPAPEHHDWLNAPSTTSWSTAAWWTPRDGGSWR